MVTTGTSSVGGRENDGERETKPSLPSNFFCQRLTSLFYFYLFPLTRRLCTGTWLKLKRWESLDCCRLFIFLVLSLFLLLSIGVWLRPMQYTMNGGREGRRDELSGCSCTIPLFLSMHWLQLLFFLVFLSLFPSLNPHYEAWDWNKQQQTSKATKQKQNKNNL